MTIGAIGFRLDVMFGKVKLLDVQKRYSPFMKHVGDDYKINSVINYKRKKMMTENLSTKYKNTKSNICYNN